MIDLLEQVAAPPQSTIPYGYCHCGCGRKTNPAPYNYASKGLVKGVPQLYCKGHRNAHPRPPSRIIVVDGVECRTIPLTQGKEAIVDVQDYDRLSQWRWYAKKINNGWYALRSSHEHGQTVFLHHAILGADDGGEIDHSNRDPLDNRRCNLRCSTVAQNQWNTRRHKDSKHRFKGVVRISTNSYLVRISANGVRHTIGYFRDEIEAAKAYDAAAIQYHGEYAQLNFPEVKA